MTQENTSMVTEDGRKPTLNMISGEALIADLRYYVDSFEVFNGTIFEYRLLEGFQELISRNIVTLLEVKNKNGDLFKSVEALIRRFDETKYKRLKKLLAFHSDFDRKYYGNKGKTHIQGLMESAGDCFKINEKVYRSLIHQTKYIQLMLVYLDNDRFILTNDNFLFAIENSVIDVVKDTYEFLLRDVQEYYSKAEKPTSLESFQFFSSQWNRDVSVLRSMIGDNHSQQIDYYLDVIPDSRESDVFSDD